MFRRVLNTTVRATLTLFLRDFFENVTSQSFDDLRVGASIHVVLKNLAIKRTIADEILKNTPFKLLHAGLDRLQAELTLNTTAARKLLLQEVHVVLEFNPDWVPAPPSNDAPPPIPSGISGAAAIVYSSNTGEVLEDSFLRDDMKAILSKRNFNEEEAIRMPVDEVDRSASAVAALLKELVHHSEVAIDGFTVRIRFPPSKSNKQDTTSTTSTPATTNEILVRFPSIFIRDKTVFDGKPSDQFSKFISIAPPIIQIYPMTQEDFDHPVSSTGRELSYEDTLAMGYGFLHASAEMARLRDEAAAKSTSSSSSSSTPTSPAPSPVSGARSSPVGATVERDDDLGEGAADKSKKGGSSGNNSNSKKTSPTTNEAEVEGMDFHTVMESQRCVTIEVVRRALQPRVPTWDVKISTTPFLICIRPYQIGLLLDIGYRLSAQAALQEKVLLAREQEQERQAAAMLERERLENANYPRNFYNNSTMMMAMMNYNNNNHNNTNNISSSQRLQQKAKSSAPPSTFCITAKCQHGVLALFTTDDVVPIRHCWERIEDFGSFIPPVSAVDDSSSSSSCLPRCLVMQNRGYIALSAGSGKIVIEKNNSLNSVTVTPTTTTTSTTTTASAAGTGSVVDQNDNNKGNFLGETEMERFLDRYTETTFTASLGSFVVVEKSTSSSDFVKIIEVDGQDRNSNNNNNNNSNSSNTIAGEIVFKITEAVPFHDVLKHKCVNLTGVRHRHPTTNEMYSQALLKSTVTVRDFSLRTARKSVIRLEPTILSRVVDLMNYINSDIIKVAMARNGVPLPKLKDIVTENGGDDDLHRKTGAKLQSPLSAMNEPFNDDATTISMTFHEVDVQCLLLKSRMPAPDIWGPLTCRLFDHLAEASDSSSPTSHLLPRSFVIRGSNLKFTTCPGTEPAISQLTLTSAEALIIQHKDGTSRTLLRVSPSDKIHQFSLQTSIRSDPFGVPDVAKLDKIAAEIAQRPTSDQAPIIQQKLKNELSSVAVDILIPRIHGVTDILMDDLIFVLYSVTDLSEITLPLVRYIPLDETAAYVAAKSFVPNSVTSINLLLQEVQLFLGAPRLDKHGVCLGEPLSSLLPPQQAPRNLIFALHRYEVRATQLTLTLGIAAVTPLAQHWGMALGLGGFSLREHVIQLDGHPGAVHILCDSFADAHRRSYEGAADRRRGRSGRVFNLTLIRDICYRKRSDLMQIGIVVECVSLVQQASYEGDSWPAVLTFWSADTPTRVKAGGKVHERGAVQQADVVPLASAISVNVTARDLLLDWKPEMRKERIVVLVSAVDVEIPQLVTGDPKLTATVRVPEPAALLLHNDFPTPVIEFDRAMFVTGVNIFGSTRKGALEDLQYLGFAQLCTVGPRPSSMMMSSSMTSSSSASPSSTSSNNAGTNSASSRTPTIVVRKNHPGTNRKVQVEVRHFFTEFSFAPDSCALFIAFLEHIHDPKYVSQCVTSPVRLTRRAGGSHYSRVQPSVQAIQAVPMRAYFQDADFLDELPPISSAASSSGATWSSSSRQRQQQQRHEQLLIRTEKALMRNSRQREVDGNDDEDGFNQSEWDLPELDERGREKPNAFVLKENVLRAYEESAPQQQNYRQPPTLSQLMSDLHYFQPPIYDESILAEPLFNVPATVEFELLLHSCDFKVSFFAGSDFEMLLPLMMRRNNNNNSNNNKMTNLTQGTEYSHVDPTTSERFNFDGDDDDEDDEAGSTSRGGRGQHQQFSNTATHAAASNEISSFHSIHATVPIFDVINLRQVRRKARNSSECVALWLMRCFTQIDIFPTLSVTFNGQDGDGDVEEKNHDNDDDDDDDDETAENSQGDSAKKKSQSTTSVTQEFTPVRQIIFRAGEIEVEDLVHESPVRKMLYCALPKSQRDAPVVTLRVRTLQKDAPPSLGDTSQPPPTFEALVQQKAFQKLEAQQVSLRLLPLGVNISARTVMKVIAVFVNMNATKVALSNQKPLPSIASAADSLASLAQSENSGIASVRLLDSASNFHSVAENSPNNSTSATHAQAAATAAAAASAVSAPPTFFDKLIIHPVDLRISWFPDESLYSDERVAEVLKSQWLLFIVRHLAIEGARLSLSRISLSSVNLEDVASGITAEAWPQLQSSRLLLLVAGLQPVRPAAEVAGALGDLILTPLEYWQHQRSIFVGIARGIQTCTSRLAAESLTLTATGTRLGQHAALAMTKGIQRNPTPMLWGNQPQTIGEGAVRALRSAEKGLLDFGSGVLFCVDEMKQSSVSGGLMRLPLSLLIPVEGVLRGMTEAVLGIRNTIRPEERARDTQEFKSTVFSHKRGDSDDDDDDDNDNSKR